MALLWLSFADGSRPKGEQFLGVAIVEADDVKGAAIKCWELGINPGGQILSMDLPEPWPPADYHDRLLQKPDLAALSELMAEKFHHPDGREATLS